MTTASNAGFFNPKTQVASLPTGSEAYRSICSPNYWIELERKGIWHRPYYGPSTSTTSLSWYPYERIYYPGNGDLLHTIHEAVIRVAARYSEEDPDGIGTPRWWSFRFTGIRSVEATIWGVQAGSIPTFVRWMHEAMHGLMNVVKVSANPTMQTPPVKWRNASGYPHMSMMILYPPGTPWTVLGSYLYKGRPNAQATDGLTSRGGESPDAP